VQVINLAATHTLTTNTVRVLRGVNSVVTIDAAGNNATGDINAVTGTVIASSAGNISSMEAFIAGGSFTGAATITDYIGLHITNPGNTGGATLTNQYGILIDTQNRAATQAQRFALVTNQGHVVFNEEGSPNADVRWESNTEANMLFMDAGAEIIWLGGSPTGIQIAIGGQLTMPDAADIVFNTTTGTKIGTATNQKLGFYNATPIVQPTEITDELTGITHTAPGTPDYALQDLVDSGVGSAFGFATKGEGHTLLSVVANLQARQDELETVLVSLGLLADAD
jgi:hypothetical protein